jgi:hypothetical protein
VREEGLVDLPSADVQEGLHVPRRMSSSPCSELVGILLLLLLITVFPSLFALICRSLLTAPSIRVGLGGRRAGG